MFDENSVQMFEKSLGLDYVIDRAEEIQEKCDDILLSNVGKNFIYTPDGEFEVKDPFEDDILNFIPSDFALSQWCNKIGVPTRYIKKCMNNEEMDLAARNINTWSNKVDSNKSYLIRTYEDQIRGILSDKFSVFDTSEVLSCLDHVADYKVKGLLLTPERFHLRLIDPIILPIEGEDLFAGIQIDSSDVGKSTLKAQFFIHKLVCSNGLTINELGGTLYEHKHIGINEFEFKREFEESLTLIPQLIKESIEHIKTAKEDCDFEKLIENARKDLDLPEEMELKVFNLVRENYTFNKWGVINGLTEVAQDFSLDTRIKIEAYAGGLLVA